MLAHDKVQRFAIFATIMDEIAAQLGFDPRCPPQRAAQILHAMLSEEAYGLLVVEQG